MAAEDTKRKLVEAAYKMLMEEGFENVKARNVAKEAGYAATAIYKHFGSLNFLTTLASFKLLDEYNQKSIEISTTVTDCIQMSKISWRYFLFYAFQNVPVFENLFWGKAKAIFEEVVLEYFQLYPEQIKDQTATFFYLAYFNSSIEERDFMLFRRAANEGRLTLDDAAYISRVNSLVTHAALREHMEDYKDPAIAKRAAEDCYKIIEKTIDKCLIDQKVDGKGRSC